MIHSYWLDWLVLRDILNVACNITSGTYKGWAVGRGGEGRLTLPVDTADQTACPVGQTNSNISP